LDRGDRLDRLSPTYGNWQDGTVKKGLHRPRLSAIIPNLTAAGSHPDCRAVLIQIVAQQAAVDS
jgi:hypothetical protein